MSTAAKLVHTKRALPSTIIKLLSGAVFRSSLQPFYNDLVFFFVAEEFHGTRYLGGSFKCGE